MSREIKLDGGEISVLKAIGLTGAPVAGKMLLDRAGDMETAELLDTLSGLMSLGYVLADKANVRLVEDVQRSSFRVNPAYSSDLKDALFPSRQRNERRERRRRH